MRIYPVCIATLALIGCMPHKPPKPDAAVAAELPPPSLALFDCGDRFAFAPNFVPLEEACLDRLYPGMDQTVRLDGSTLTVRVPAGWEVHYAGKPAWVGLELDSRARIVIYPVRDVGHAFFEEWLADMIMRKDSVTEFPYWNDARRQGPFLFRYWRNDLKLGVVYGRALSDGGESGVIVHGLWSSEHDRDFLPIAMAVAAHLTVAW